MQGLIRRAVGAMAATILTATLSTAQSAPPAPSTPVPETPLSFSSQSSGSSAALLLPAWVLFGMGFALDNDAVRVPGVGGRSEKVHVHNNLSSARLELGWDLGGHSAASSAASSALGLFSSYLVFGLLARRDNINAFKFPGGSVATNGDSDFWGIYSGLNVRLLGNTPTAAAASSSLAAYYWSGFFNVGYGEADVTAFGGFNRYSGKGIFYEIGSELMVDLGPFYAGPAILYRHFDHGQVKSEETVVEFRVNVPLRRN